MTTINNLYDLADCINSCVDDYPIEDVYAAIEANGWINTESCSDNDICSDGEYFLVLKPNNEKGCYAEVDDRLYGTPCDEYIIEALRFACKDKNLAINITSREDAGHLDRKYIEYKEAELVRFTFGDLNDSCVALLYEDGEVFVPSDWQSKIWDDTDWVIGDDRIEWMDLTHHRAKKHNGMPWVDVTDC